jgi:predicted methyltransferase
MRRGMLNRRAMKFSGVGFAIFLILGCGATQRVPPEPPGPPAVPASAPASTPPAPATPAPVESVEVTPAVAQALAAPDRAEAERALDAGRKPEQWLSFFGIAPGQHVAEIAAGGGYTSELLARIVGPSGSVIGENPSVFLQRFAEKPWSERLAKPVMKNVVRSDGEPAAPFPPGTSGLDAVLSVLVYHDTVWQGVDRAAMNRAVFAALRPGGVYGVIDHSGRPGTGTTETQTLHRIEESALRAEVTQAGFVLDGEGAFLRNSADTRDWSASPRSRDRWRRARRDGSRSA